MAARSCVRVAASSRYSTVAGIPITELIQPAGALVQETTQDAAGAPMTYMRAELRFHLEATYRDLGEYLNDIEAMDQLVVVRSVSLTSGEEYPELGADVAIWVYGTP